MTTTLINENLNTLRNKTKLYNYLSSYFTRAYFKVEGEEFVFMLRGQTGVLQTSLPLRTPFKGKVYFSVDYMKWQLALQKFEYADEVNLDFTQNLLKISSPNSSDVINLGIIYFKEDSSEATIMDKFLPTKKNEILDKKKITITDEIVDALNFADSLFTAQSTQVNSIGLGRKDIMYADRATVMKIYLQSSLPDHLFFDDEGNSIGDYIFIHSLTIKLFNFLVKTSSEVYFTPDYGTLYWEDDNTQIFLVSEDRKVALPTAEEFEGIKPSSNNEFEVNTDTLKKSLDFFAGFYEGSVWKPVTFNVIPGKEVMLYYRHPSAEITKALSGAQGNVEGAFTVDSETLKKVIGKEYSSEDQIVINYDEEAPGIFIKTPKCEAVISKLDD